MSKGESPLQEMRCTIHNLRFAFDPDRLRIATGLDPAVAGRCPACSAKDIEALRHSNTQLREHRDLLVSAIDLTVAVQAEILR